MYNWCADIALCYYKLDFYDVSQEVLSVYLQKIPDSLIALNLKACNIYRLYNGRSAEIEIRSLLVIVDFKKFNYSNSALIKFLYYYQRNLKSIAHSEKIY